MSHHFVSRFSINQCLRNRWGRGTGTNFGRCIENITLPVICLKRSLKPIFCQHDMDHFWQKNSHVARAAQVGGQGGYFGRLLNPISTRGTHHPQPVLLAPPDFQTLRRAWQLKILFKLCPKQKESKNFMKKSLSILFQ